jgi:hypothetical protein
MVRFTKLRRDLVQELRSSDARTSCLPRPMNLAVLVARHPDGYHHHLSDHQPVDARRVDHAQLSSVVPAAWILLTSSEILLEMPSIREKADRLSGLAPRTKLEADDDSNRLQVLK